jgi:hypothetical protein
MLGDDKEVLRMWNSKQDSQEMNRGEDSPPKRRFVSPLLLFLIGHSLACYLLATALFAPCPFSIRTILPTGDGGMNCSAEVSVLLAPVWVPALMALGMLMLFLMVFGERYPELTWLDLLTPLCAYVVLMTGLWVGKRSISWAFHRWVYRGTPY